MKPICHKVQETLAGEGPQALGADLASRRHLEECPECSAAMESLAALDQALESLPALDAPDATVRRLLTRVEQAKPGWGRDGRWLGGLAAAVSAGAAQVRPVFWGFAAAAGVAAFVGLTVPSLYRARTAPPLYDLDSEDPRLPARADVNVEPLPSSGEAELGLDPAQPAGAYRRQDEPLSEAEAERLQALGYLAVDELESRLKQQQVLDRGRKEGDVSAPVVFEPGEEVAAALSSLPDGGVSGHAATQEPDARLRKNEAAARVAKVKTDETVAEAIRDAEARDQVREGTDVAGDRFGDRLDRKRGDDDALGPIRVGGSLAAPKKVVDAEPTYPEAARQATVEGVVVLEVTVDEEGRVTDAKLVRGHPLLDKAALDAVKRWRYQPTLLNGRPVPVVMTVTVTFRLSAKPEDEHGAIPDRESTRTARAFLTERAETEGLAIEAPRGYWANTYLPGDPLLRLLQSRLAAWDRSALEAAAGVPLRLHDDARQTRQPFDPPRRGALALYVHADRRGLEGPGRMLVQVGLQGSARAGARRPAMSVALVFDLRGNPSVEVAAGMRALALAFSQAREAGDRFQIVVAGRPGGIVVRPSQFTHGPLVVTLGRLLEGGDAPDAPNLDLEGAVATALEAVSRGDNPEAPLGSSTVVLVTGQPLGPSTKALAGLAHQGAVAGIPLSVVGVGPHVPVRDMDAVALAGQGSRRRLESRSEALALVEQELAGAARVVARAVRLRIRLAPGVRLVEVVGSQRLAERQVQRVREAERSIDLRLSRNLGLEADRGEDEDGIQIVIPSFHAGDGHAVLLDVIAPGPGPIAEVTARYKDIVSLRNGVARASLRLDSGVETEGPLERNVLKNLLARHLADTLERAGECLRAGDPVQAARLLEGARELRLGLGSLSPALAGDPGLGRDIAMLGEYVQLLHGAAATHPNDHARLADSLRYAGRLKVLPRPAPVSVPGA